MATFNLTPKTFRIDNGEAMPAIMGLLGLWYTQRKVQVNTTLRKKFESGDHTDIHEIKAMCSACLGCAYTAQNGTAYDFRLYARGLIAFLLDGSKQTFVFARSATPIGGEDHFPLPVDAMTLLGNLRKCLYVMTGTDENETIAWFQVASNLKTTFNAGFRNFGAERLKDIFPQAPLPPPQPEAGTAAPVAQDVSMKDATGATPKDNIPPQMPASSTTSSQPASVVVQNQPQACMQFPPAWGNSVGQPYPFGSVAQQTSAFSFGLPHLSYPPPVGVPQFGYYPLPTFMSFGATAANQAVCQSSVTQVKNSEIVSQRIEALEDVDENEGCYDGTKKRPRYNHNNRGGIGTTVSMEDSRANSRRRVGAPVGLITTKPIVRAIANHVNASSFPPEIWTDKTPAPSCVPSCDLTEEDKAILAPVRPKGRFDIFSSDAETRPKQDNPAGHIGPEHTALAAIDSNPTPPPPPSITNRLIMQPNYRFEDWEQEIEGKQPWEQKDEEEEEKKKDLIINSDNKESFFDSGARLMMGFIDTVLSFVVFCVIVLFNFCFHSLYVSYLMLQLGYYGVAVRLWIHCFSTNPVDTFFNNNAMNSVKIKLQEAGRQ